MKILSNNQLKSSFKSVLDDKSFISKFTNLVKSVDTDKRYANEVKIETKNYGESFALSYNVFFYAIAYDGFMPGDKKMDKALANAETYIIDFGDFEDGYFCKSIKLFQIDDQISLEVYVLPADKRMNVTHDAYDETEPYLVDVEFFKLNEYSLDDILVQVKKFVKKYHLAP